MGFETLKQDLLAILEEETDAFRRMLDLLKEQQRALVQNNVAAIQANVERQRQMTEAVGLIEARRVQATRGIGQRFGLGEEALTVSRLCDFYEGEDVDRARALRETLLDLHAEIRQTNRNNALLIRHAVRYVDRTLQLLKGGDGTNRVYHRSGVTEGISPALRAAVNRVA